MDQLIAVAMLYGRSSWTCRNLSGRTRGDESQRVDFHAGACRTHHFWSVEMLILMRPELAGPQSNPGWIVEVLVC